MTLLLLNYVIYTYYKILSHVIPKPKYLHNTF